MPRLPRCLGGPASRVLFLDMTRDGKRFGEMEVEKQYLRIYVIMFVILVKLSDLISNGSEMTSGPRCDQLDPKMGTFFRLCAGQLRRSPLTSQQHRNRAAWHRFWRSQPCGRLVFQARTCLYAAKTRAFIHSSGCTASRI